MKNQARHPSKVPSVCCLHGFIKGVRSAHGTRNERHQDKDLGSSLKSPPRLIPNLGRRPNLRSFSQRPVADVPPNREKEMAPPLDVAPSASGEYVAMFHGRSTKMAGWWQNRATAKQRSSNSRRQTRGCTDLCPQCRLQCATLCQLLLKLM